MSGMPRIPRRGKKDDDPKMIGLWKIGRTIGKGSSGRVRIARHSKTGKYAAVKIVSKNALLNSRMSMHNLGDEAERILHSIEREIVIMKLIEHPNIMRLYDVWETSSELYLILEYVEGGELFEYLCNKGRLSTPEALGYFQQIITAINYCHRFNIAHRDLKPENLLLDADMNIKVADFGMAIWQGKTDLLQTACGSPHYAAPEVIMGRAYNGTSSDVWSCGIILFALLAGRLPFDDEDLPALLEKVKIGKYTMPKDIDPAAQNLITRMLEKDVHQRITIPEILKHPFYISHPPKDMHCDIPNLDEIARPVKDASSIDPDILANLHTLWPGMSDDALLRSLTNDRPTWEKGVYHLLARYRARHLENYDEEEENKLVEEQSKRRSKKRRSHQADQHLTIPARSGPPTPRRASREDRDHLHPDSRSGSPGPSRMRQVRMLGSTLLASPQSSMEIPPTPEDFHSPNTTPVSARPTGDGILTSPLMKIPEVQDEKIQHFFQQIVNHLAVMQHNTPSVASSSQDAMNSPAALRAPPTTPLTLDLGKPFDARRVATTNPSTDTFAFGPSRTTNSTRPLSIRRRTDDHLDKENTQPKKSSYLSVEAPERKSSLRSNQTSRVGSRHVQIAEPLPGERSSKLKKKRSAPYSPASSSAFSVSDGGSSFVFSSVPRRTWLGNLFRFKPASFQLVSTQDAAYTRQECREILESLGLTVVLTQAEGMGVLKCKLEDSRDPTGLMAPIKAVKFRVEVYRPTTLHAIAGYKSTLNLVLEKGAASTFKMVFNRLRREWELDGPPGTQRVEMAATPSASVSPRHGFEEDEEEEGLPEDERFVEVVYAN
ncbi:kinase-like domain-containing protein [Cristinia sonorae]|uniref:non-specific serine/threonine protein kinase n=1 Tax=Cristinia sonorae TaxID=1940300 RepID=A0A8K0UW75_9AGAR|nr:kinase-like domain-containing protein [Cristinia sonorae]